MSTSADTFAQAKKRFEEMAGIFFEEIFENNTYEQVLQELGWEEVESQYVPPTVITHDTETINVEVPCKEVKVSAG